MLARTEALKTQLIQNDIIYHGLPSSVSSLRSDVPTMADIKIIEPTTMLPVTTATTAAFPSEFMI